MDNILNNHDRTIFITGIIDQDENSTEIKKNIIKMATEKPNQPVNLIIDSSGGNTSTAISIVELILYYNETTFNTIASGDCASSAFIIFLAGTNRYSFPHSVLMSHDPLLSISSEADQDVKKLKTFIDVTGEVYEEFMKKILKRTKLTYKKYKQKTDQLDWWITAEEAAKLGIVTEIIDVWGEYE